MRVTLPALNDLHVHFRELHQARHLAGVSAQWCENVLAMPNLARPLRHAYDLNEYAVTVQPAGMNARVAFYLTPDMTPDDIDTLYRRGYSVAKVYPHGMTTHAGHGVTSYVGLYPLFARMEDLDGVVCFHGEAPGAFVLDAEALFLSTILHAIVDAFPRLRIVLEHVTTEEAVAFVHSVPTGKVAATVTAHHLLITLDDVIGPGGLQPRNFCKPVAKRPGDRAALLAAATDDDPRFFLGSDSAPWTAGSKYVDCGCAGVYTAAYLPHYLATAFDGAGKMDRLPDFSSNRARAFYRLPPARRTLTLKRGKTKIPTVMEGYLPFLGGEELPWEVEQV